MSSALNAEFRADPLAFAQVKVLGTSELARTMTKRRALRYDYHDPGDQEVTLYSKVRRDNRVAYADIEPGPAAAGFAGTYRLNLQSVYAATLIPVFWLPYAQNKTHRITLEDRRDAATIRRSGGDARFFFTNALNGCSVIVEGSLENPTVYHANAATYRVTEGPIDDLKTHDDRIERMRKMENSWRGTQAPKRVRNPRAGETASAAAVLHGHDYMPDYLKLDAAGANTIDSAYVTNACGLMGVPIANVARSQVDHTAFAFGFKPRNSDAWEFWVQQRARVRVTLHDEWSQMTYVGRTVTKFWPGRANCLAIRGNHPHNAIIVSGSY